MNEPNIDKLAFCDAVCILKDHVRFGRQITDALAFLEIRQGYAFQNSLK